MADAKKENGIWVTLFRKDDGTVVVGSIITNQTRHPLMGEKVKGTTENTPMGEKVEICVLPPIGELAIKKPLGGRQAK